MRFLKNRKILLLVLGLLLIFSWFYYQSEILKRQGDDLLKFGKPEQAIEVYKKVQQTYPFRFDISDDIEGAKLVAQSSKQYAEIVDEEFQNVPSLSNIPAVVLAPNELFVPILMYHHIRPVPISNDPVSLALNVTPAQLSEQLSFLKTNGYTIISLDDLENALSKKTPLPDKPIILTFDDGYKDFYENAFPILKKYNVKATEFVITKVLDISPYLTWNQIKEMDKSGLITIGAHTRHHANLPDISQKDIIDEVKGSKADLESQLKKPVNWFAYPYGSYNSFIMNTVKSAGFKGAASTVYGVNQSRENAFLEPRIMIDGRFTLDNIARRIQK